MENKKAFTILAIVVGFSLFGFFVAYNNGYKNGFQIGLNTGFYRCLKGISENEEMIPTAKDAENFLKDNPDIIKGVDY